MSVVASIRYPSLVTPLCLCCPIVVVLVADLLAPKTQRALLWVMGSITGSEFSSRVDFVH
jgi:hypothetical protein